MSVRLSAFIIATPTTNICVTLIFGTSENICRYSQNYLGIG
jgi:hypothetical protein